MELEDHRVELGVVARGAPHHRDLLELGRQQGAFGCGEASGHLDVHRYVLDHEALLQRVAEEVPEGTHRVLPRGVAVRVVFVGAQRTSSALGTFDLLACCLLNRVVAQLTELVRGHRGERDVAEAFGETGEVPAVGRQRLRRARLAHLRFEFGDGRHGRVVRDTLGEPGKLSGPETEGLGHREQGLGRVDAHEVTSSFSAATARQASTASASVARFNTRSDWVSGDKVTSTLAPALTARR